MLWVVLQTPKSTNAAKSNGQSGRGCSGIEIFSAAGYCIFIHSRQVLDRMSDREKAKEFLMQNHAFIEQLDEHLHRIEKQIKSIMVAESPSIEDVTELKNEYDLYASQREQLVDTRSKLLGVIQEMDS
ncbi:MAG: hypothetical protein ACI9TH_001899 [Kiritimatiellia bacterium]|jgi:hypothetical protein